MKTAALSRVSVSSPVGRLELIATEKGLAAVLWENDKPERVPLPPAEENTAHPILTKAAEQLAGYFAGKRKTFQIPGNVSGTAFQKEVWAALAEIPFGETRTYGQIAEKIGRPTASRAVGAAIGRNPLSIIVPCHRVIGGNGSLTGFAGGLERKKQLLAMEAAAR